MTQKTLQRRHIEALVAVGAANSVHAAARTLGVPQPVMSRLVSELEALLGARLFERSSRGSRPTAAGEAALARARVLMRGIDRLGQLAAAARPVVALGCIPRVMHTLVPQLLEALYPPGAPPAPGDFRLEVSEDSSAQLLEAVGRGQLDFAILRHIAGVAGVGAGLHAEHLYDERSQIVCAVGSPLARARGVTLQRLAAQGWVLPSRATLSREVFDTFWSGQGLPPVHRVIETRSFESIVALVRRSHFVSLLPESIAKRQVALGEVRVVKVTPQLPVCPVMLVSDPLAVEDPSLRRLHDLVHAAAARTRRELA